MNSIQRAIEPQLHWTDHFVKYGFAIVPGLLERDFCAAALARTREVINQHLPLNEWTSKNTPILYKPYFEGGNAEDPVFGQLFEQPRLGKAIDELFGGPGRWNRMKNFYLMVRAYEPEGQAVLATTGHIDFPNQPVPLLYRGCAFQASLLDMEPFSGSLTVYPATHRTVQKILMDNPNVQLKSGTFEKIETPEPFEFIGQTGDVCFFHHLVLHSGNSSHAANRTPRVALMGEAFSDHWWPSVDPASPNLSPLERSVAWNGPYRAPPEVESDNMKKRSDYLETLRKQELQPAAVVKP